MQNSKDFRPQKPKTLINRYIEEKIFWPAERKFFEILSTALFIFEDALAICLAPFTYALKKIANKVKQRPS